MQLTKHQFEENLEKAYSRTEVLLAFVDNHIDLVCIVNKNGSFEYVNQSFILHLGYTKAELYNRKLLDFIHPEDLERTAKAYMKPLNKPFINRYIRKNGTTITLEWSHIYYDSGNLRLATAKKIDNG